MSISTVCVRNLINPRFLLNYQELCHFHHHTGLIKIIKSLLYNILYSFMYSFMYLHYYVSLVWHAANLQHFLATIRQVLCIIVPAVPLGNLFDCQSHLVTEVTTCIDDAERAFTQNHPLAVLIIFIVILHRHTQTHGSALVRMNYADIFIFLDKIPSKVMSFYSHKGTFEKIAGQEAHNHTHTFT